jgi:nucleotide-binding universal stress UspA family protein
MSTPVRRIVVGYDESQGSVEALAWVAPTAAALGAEVIVVRAYSPLDELGRNPDGLDFPALRDAAARRLAGVAGAALEAAGVTHRSELIEDEPPHEVLCRACGDLGADLLVVGSHGQGGWKERFTGSVATKLLAHAPCPVTIVPQVDPRG